MKKFELNGKSFEMPTSWSDLTLKHYVNLATLEENKTQYLLGELYLLKVIEVLCDADAGELDDLTIDMVTELSKEVGFLQQEPTWNNTKNITIADVDYAFPADLNKLTMGEYISIKTLQENSPSQAGAIPLILAVILRPAKLIKDEESGLESWIQDRFDANNIEYRKDLFLKQPVFDLMGPVTFFLSGSGISTPNTKASMEKELK
jgi:hypothetical protein